MNLKISKELIFSILVFLIGVAFVIYFTPIVLYMIIAAIVALMGRPLKSLLLKIKIKGKSPSGVIASILTLLIMIITFSTIFLIILPAIAGQLSELVNLDYKAISHNINQSLLSTEDLLKNYGIIKPNESLAAIIQSYLTSFVSDIQINKIASDAISAIGTLFIGVFSVLFITFFFIRDENLFQNIILLFIPEKKRNNGIHILTKIRKMLSRYFVGLLTEIGSMMILESIGGLILGLPNAILIGFIGGLLNIIPYIGPLIGGLMAIILVTISNITMGMDATLPLIYGIIGVFAVANLIDNFLLQPIIYSNSVKAHPLEIFIIIIVGGTLYGPVGMIVAIPIYTILRVIAKEFFSEQDFIKKVTKSL